jgi:hypothetical protein
VGQSDIGELENFLRYYAGPVIGRDYRTPVVSGNKNISGAYIGRNLPEVGHPQIKLSGSLKYRKQVSLCRAY